MTRTRRFILPAILVILASFLLGACTKTMDAGKVEKSAKSFLKGKLGAEKFNTVKCPDGVAAKTGKNFTCTFKGSEGTTGKLNVEVTSTDGDATITVKSVKYTAAFVEDAITKDFGTQYPDQAANLKAVDCPSDIPSTIGDTVKCSLTSGDGQAADLTVTVTAGNNLDWDFTEITG